jgi:hypothetical protein
MIQRFFDEFKLFLQAENVRADHITLLCCYKTYQMVVFSTK